MNIILLMGLLLPAYRRSTGPNQHIKKVEQDINDIEKDLESMSKQELNDMVKKITKQMHTAAAELNFELAAELRDKMIEIKKHLLDFNMQ